MNRQQFAQTIKQKYPQYMNIPDEQLVDKVMTKYPQYKSKVEGSWLTGNRTSTLGKVGEAAGNLLNIPSYALGGMLDQFQNKGIKAANPLTNPFGIRGAVQGIKNKQALMTEAPETLGIDPNSTAGKIVGFGAEVLMPSPTDFLNVGKVAGKGAQAVGQGIEGRARGVVTAGLGNPQLQGKIGKIGGKNSEQLADFMIRQNLLSRDPAEVEQLLGSLYKEYNRLGMDSGTSTSVADILKPINDEIARLEQAVLQRPGGKIQQQLDQLIANRDQIVKQIGGSESVVPLQAPTSSIIKYRRLIDEDIPENAFSRATVPAGSLDANLQTRDILTGATRKSDPRLQQLGQDISRATQTKKLFENAQNRANARQSVGIGDLLAGTGVGTVTGLTFGGVPGIITGALGIAGKKFLDSSAGAKAQYAAYSKVGKGVQKSAPLFSRVTNALGRVGTTLFRLPASSGGRKESSLNSKSNILPGKESGLEVNQGSPYKPIIQQKPTMGLPQPTKYKKLQFSAPDNPYKKYLGN